jgi:polyhydroxyalkanoate synthesis regulator protein
VITLAGVTLVLVFSHVNWYGFFGNFTFMMLYTFLGRSFEFFAGIQLALIVRKQKLDGQKKPNLPTWASGLYLFVCG